MHLGTFEGERRAASRGYRRRLLNGKPTVSDFHEQLSCRVLAHIGKHADAIFAQRALGAAECIEFRFGAMVRAMTTADLCSCLAQHPDQAVEFIIRNLDFRQPLAHGHLHRPGDRAIATLDHPAPDRLANIVATRHSSVSPCARKTHLGTFEGERNRQDCAASTARSLVQDLTSILAILSFWAALGFIAMAVLIPELPV